MIKEDYVSFETAKLLKEKGFNIETIKYWENEGGLTTVPSICEGSEPYDNSYLGTYEYSCPTLQMAMKWLREVKNLFVFPFPQVNTNKFWAEIYQLSDNQEWENLYCESIDLQDYPTYEDACEAAIKYCLEHLI